MGCSGPRRATEGAPALPCACTAPPAARGARPTLNTVTKKKPKPNKKTSPAPCQTHTLQCLNGESRGW